MIKVGNDSFLQTKFGQKASETISQDFSLKTIELETVVIIVTHEKVRRREIFLRLAGEVPVTRDHPLFRIGSQVGCVASSWKEVY